MEVLRPESVRGLQRAGGNAKSDTSAPAPSDV